MTNKFELRATPEMIKVMLHVMRAKEAERIVEILKNIIKVVNDEGTTQTKYFFYGLVIETLESTGALRNYEELTQQIMEVENGEEPTFN
jgi:hypothetical protein